MVFRYSPAILFRHVFFVAFAAAGDLPVCMRTEWQMAYHALTLVKKTVSATGDISQLVCLFLAFTGAIDFIMPSPKKGAADRTSLIVCILGRRLVSQSENASRRHLLRRLRALAAVSLALPAGRLIAERIEQADTALAFFTHFPPSNMRLWCHGQLPSHGISPPHSLAPGE